MSGVDFDAASTVRPITTAQSVRDSDEAFGRAWRDLVHAVYEINGMVTHHTWQQVDAEYHGVVIQCIPGQPGQIRERGTDPLEVIDRARDRLNREEWDQ
ncbi:hypothetical protein [Gordonia sp. WA4-43]|uniref:hypothetical protein n=1 Tax=Gordonia sp. WA4-43 TaxID=2878678 RepID=UPI001CFC32E2|nr:hypothetical protein [Gordonia sp. WA4-43]UCZ89032.1 hypothetical protein LEL84_18530 [Gordonia sp. WA4-43]